jgi:hypothetical protein
MQWVPEVHSSEAKQRGREADYLPPSNAEIKAGVIISPLLHVSSWHVAYLIKHRNNFTFFLPTIILPNRR